MNSSAKFSVITLLASLALGVAAIQGCSVSTNSGSNPDTGGGIQPGTGDDDDDDDNTTPDSGTDANPTATCEDSKQAKENEFAPESCQTCMEGSCCTQLTTCFGLLVDSNGDGIHDATDDFDCNDLYRCAYTDCVTDHPGDQAAQDACAQECVTDGNAPTAVLDALDAINSCGTTNCNATANCNFVQ